MNLIRLAIDKPVSVSVVVLLTLLFGLLALMSIPVQMTPNVDSTVIIVSTFWEGASPQEVEQEIVDRQEDKLKSITGLKKMTSQSLESSASITLEFYVGIDKDEALREVSDKLREVPSYPENVDEPVISARDPRSRDYIAWIMFESTDPDIDIRTLFDFADERVKPQLERAKGVAEVNVLGGMEREVQVRFDPIRMAQLGVTYAQLSDALRSENVNLSAGSVDSGKSSVRVRTVGQYEKTDDIEQTIIAYTTGGPIRVGDVAEAVLTFKEPNSFVRSMGHTVMAINVQREVGTNVIEVMKNLKASINRLNAPGGMLDAEARRLGLNGTLRLRQVYDQTIYINSAVQLVIKNIFIGGGLAIATLLIFLRSVRAVGVIALAIPISIIGTFVAMVALGRNLNVISLAGLAFAVGMVVDNAIVVLENIFRHMEMGQKPMAAAYRGTTEVWGAIVASTLTTVAVFVPILYVEEEAGQLFRDIALAICASVLLSLVTSITVIPCAANRWFRTIVIKRNAPGHADGSLPTPGNHEPPRWGRTPSGLVAHMVYFLCGSVLARIVIVLVFAVGAVGGSRYLMPPADYLPNGNRNIVFGIIFTPPGYNLDTMASLGRRVEAEIEPFWDAGKLKQTDPAAYARAVEALPEIPSFNWFTRQVEMVRPPAVENYFFVGLGGTMFHGAISSDPKRVIDVSKLLTHASRADTLPGTIAFSRQLPLFNLSGASGSSINIELVGDDMEQLTMSATNAYMELAREFGFETIQPSPANFNIPGPELRITLDRVRASNLGLTTRDVGLAVRALGDGAIVGEYRMGGDSIDLTMIDRNAIDETGHPVSRSLSAIGDTPIATRGGQVVPLSSVAVIERTSAPQEINRVEERRAITLQFTPPQGQPLEQAMSEIAQRIDSMRQRGVIPPTIETSLAGTADKLSAVRHALLGDNTIIGLLGSRLFLALLIVYLLMCVLFESFLYPLVILLSVPLATLGGFAALRAVWFWSIMDPYMPTQNLDVLTMLGFVILIGVVVNNAILIVHQALNFMRGDSETESGALQALPQRVAIAESVRTRLRPIMMSTLTSVGGMLPLVLMPGSGSELYRGLGSVVVGGLLVSTIFTLVLVPLLFSLVLDIKKVLAGASAVTPHGALAAEP